MDPNQAPTLAVKGRDTHVTASGDCVLKARCLRGDRVVTHT